MTVQVGLSRMVRNPEDWFSHFILNVHLLSSKSPPVIDMKSYKPATEV